MRDDWRLIQGISIGKYTFSHEIDWDTSAKMEYAQRVGAKNLATMPRPTTHFMFGDRFHEMADENLIKPTNYVYRIDKPNGVCVGKPFDHHAVGYIIPKPNQKQRGSYVFIPLEDEREMVA